MKKRIVIICGQMVMGGVEQVLLRYIDRLDPAKYDITLFFMQRGGELISAIPPHVHVSYAEYTDIRKLFRQGKLFSFLKQCYIRYRIRSAKNKVENACWTIKAMKSPALQGDIIICFHMANQVCAYLAVVSDIPKKAIWLHGQFMKDGEPRQPYEKLWSAFDRVFCVSEAWRQEFSRQFPKLQHLTQTIYNPIDTAEIIEKSKQPLDYEMLHTSILTVGRLSKEKGQQMIPEVLARLLKKKHDVHWYIMGDGPLRPEIERLAEQWQVSDRLVFLGTIANPFPYIRSCDIYVQPSFTEGFCTATNEARILQKPVVTTDIPSMHEQFQDGVTGILTEPTVDSLTDGIHRLLDSPELQLKITQNLRNLKIDNEAELEKLYRFIEEPAS